MKENESNPHQLLVYTAIFPGSKQISTFDVQRAKATRFETEQQYSLGV